MVLISRVIDERARQETLQTRCLVIRIGRDDELRLAVQHEE